MMTPDSPWREIEDTTWGAFVDELGRVDSPMLAFAEPIYRAAQGVTRLFLAHSWAENQHDTVGKLIKPDMHNPLALRARYGEPTRNNFAVYEAYPDCVAAWRRRFDDPNLPYRTTATLRDYCRVYNPTGDIHPVTGLPNNPDRYCNELLATINRLPPLEEPSMPTVQLAGMSTPITVSFPVTVAILSATQKNQRPGIPMIPAYYTQHDTGNRNAGADALMHLRYLQNGAEGQTLSYHLTVDDKQAFQMLPLNEVGWHAGDGSGPGNYTSIACELCINAGQDEAKARANAEELAAAVMKGLGLPLNRLVQHFKWSGKNCPQDMRSDGYWPTFVQRVGVRLAGTPTEPTGPTLGVEGLDEALAKKFFGPEFNPAGPLSKAWLANGKATGQWPMWSGKEQFDTRTYYYFDNGLVMWRPNDGAPIRVLK